MSFLHPDHQKEDFETQRADGHLDHLMQKNKKITTVLIRMSPIIEVLTGKPHMLL